MTKRKRCPACERPFRNEQAVRAHLRFCRAYRLKHPHAAQVPGAPEAPTSANQTEKTDVPVIVETEPIKVLKRRNGRQPQESLLLLLDIDEVYPQLKFECLDHAALARLMSSVRSNIVGVDEWVKLYWLLDDCHRDYQQMVIGMRLDPTLLFSIYQRMLGIKEQWLSFRTRELAPEDGEMSQDSCEALRAEDEYWTTIIYKIKRMLVTSR
jgi:hypothetical protein